MSWLRYQLTGLIVALAVLLGACSAPAPAPKDGAVVAIVLVVAQDSSGQVATVSPGEYQDAASCDKAIADLTQQAAAAAAAKGDTTPVTVSYACVPVDQLKQIYASK